MKYAGTNNWSLNWIKLGFVFFLFTALLGLLLRIYSLTNIPGLNYTYLLHSHSHTALLGWGFFVVSGSLLLTIGIDSKLKTQKTLFWVLGFSTLGMLVSFLYQGYGAISITFSTIHLTGMFWVSIYFLKSVKKRESRFSVKLMKWAFFWLFFSSIGILVLGPVSVFLGKSHFLYWLSVQFFLHFQFNGWFTMITLALFTDYILKGKDLDIKPIYLRMFNLSVLLTYFLLVYWRVKLDIALALNIIGIIFQAVFLFVFIRILFRTQWKKFTGPGKYLVIVGLISVSLKFLSQMLMLFPELIDFGLNSRNNVIGFIHMAMLGFVTFTICGVLYLRNILKDSRSSRLGWFFLALGYIGTEIILLSKGSILAGNSFLHQYFYPSLLLFAMLMFAGIAIILPSVFYSYLNPDNQEP